MFIIRMNFYITTIYTYNTKEVHIRMEYQRFFSIGH